MVGLCVLVLYMALELYNVRVGNGLCVRSTQDGNSIVMNGANAEWGGGGSNRQQR